MAIAAGIGGGGIGIGSNMYGSISISRNRMAYVTSWYQWRQTVSAASASA